MLLKRLSEASGVSSNESEVRDIIKDNIEDKVDELWTDVMGNLIAVKGKKKKGKKVLLSAHMDEVGLMITGIESNGLLNFRPVGNIDKRSLVSKPVIVGNDKINGVIGSKAIHLQKSSERNNPIPWSNLYIDIGTSSKKEAKKYIELGDFVSFKTKFKQLGINHAKGKAFDDRVGCSVIIDLLKYEYDFPLYVVFSVQEEVGLRGAGRAAFDIEPSMALIIESTSASDVPESEDYEFSSSLDKGPALTIMDKSLISNKKIIQGIINTSKQNDIPYQIKKSNTGGTDAGEISLTKEGIPSAVISLPSRYIHSPVSLISLKDYDYLKKLIKLYLQDLNKGEF
ncbi:MAG TPA: M42 family metallopeptidase [Halanaerobiales bacterium]|nr:M42 family metallopeptidase [Halanaerobiales bacterium]